MSSAPAWSRDRHGRMETARSLLRASPAPSPVRSPARRRSDNGLDLSGHTGGEQPTAMWASPSGARMRSRPSNLQAAVRASPSFALSRAAAGSATPERTPVKRAARTGVRSRTTQATQTEALGGKYVDGAKDICLGAFGAVGEMTAETVDFLIRVLEDRKQELLVSDEEPGLRVRASFDEDTEEASAAEVARLQLDSTSNGGAGVTELVRSRSYEALVQLEGILEARHHELMNNGTLETIGNKDR